MKKTLRWILLSLIIGILAGLSSTAFLMALDWATRTRDHHPTLLWTLPLGGLLIGFLYHYYGSEANRGHNLILDEIHSPQKKLPLRMAPLVFFSSVITHLVGGSAGREGAAIQIGGSLADQISPFFKLTHDERKKLLIVGTSAAFGAALGAPLAGMIFGMEVIHVKKIQWSSFKFWKDWRLWFECGLASLVGYYVAQLLHAPHTHYPHINQWLFSKTVVIAILCLGILSGITSRVFVFSVHGLEKIFKKMPYPPLIPMVGGFLLLLFYHLEGSYNYTGLGLTIIKDSLERPSSILLPLYKILFTALTVGSGFKGGEFVPLVFIGSTLGSSVAGFFKLTPFLPAALGFVAVFVGAANTPLTGIVLAMEFFGPHIGPYAVIVCLLSYYSSGQGGIYKSQKR